jgi:muramoyltetrapeptide carboxypeptidase
MLIGKTINSSSTIGIIAPSSYELKNKINDNINKFISIGFNVKLGNYIYDEHNLFAGTDSNRAKDITDMFLDPDIDGIVCLRGGYGAIRTLPYIDTHVLLNNPKFFCGFSDITILLNYFSSLGLITFHGPMLNSKLTDTVTVNSFIDVSSYSKDQYTYDLNKYTGISYMNPNSFSGKLIGGNLSVMCSALGTPYEIDTTDSILLIEDVNQDPYTIDRMITQLIFSGTLNKCNGIIVGYLSNDPFYNTSTSKTILENTIVNALNSLKIPIIIGFPFGHNYPNLTLPLGCNADFINDLRLLKINDNFLR